MLRWLARAVSISRRNQIRRVAATLQCGGGEQDKKMRPGCYVSEDDALEVATGDTAVIEEHVIAVMGQVLKNPRAPRNVASAITKEGRFFDAFHSTNQLASRGRDRNRTITEIDTAGGPSYREAKGGEAVCSRHRPISLPDLFLSSSINFRVRP